MGDIFVWRKSVMDTNRCPYCGAMVRFGNGYPTNNACIDAEKKDAPRGYILCGSCHGKGKGVILGEYIDIPDETSSVLKDMDGINFGEITEILKDAQAVSNRHKRELKSKDIQIETLRATIKANEQIISSLRTQKESIQSRLEADIRKLTKELKSLEHKYDKLAEQMGAK